MKRFQIPQTFQSLLRRNTRIDILDRNLIDLSSMFRSLNMRIENPPGALRNTLGCTARSTSRPTVDRLFETGVQALTRRLQSLSPIIHDQ